MKHTPSTYLNDTHARVARCVIHGLNYPKREAKRMTRGESLRARLRPLLSEWDEQEVTQTCALALHASGALYREQLALSDWMTCFRAARAILRIDRRAHEDATDIATLDAQPCFVLDAETFHARRIAIARRIRYQVTCILAAHGADKSRKRGFNRRKALEFLRYVTSQAFGTGIGRGEIISGETPDALRAAHMTFRRYVAEGEKLLTPAVSHVPRRTEIKDFAQLASPDRRKQFVANMAKYWPDIEPSPARAALISQLAA